MFNGQIVNSQIVNSQIVKLYMERTVIIDALKRRDFGSKINVRGWVRSRRGNKNVSFIALNDGSTIKNIQIVVDLANFSE